MARTPAFEHCLGRAADALSDAEKLIQSGDERLLPEYRRIKKALKALDAVAYGPNHSKFSYCAAPESRLQTCAQRTQAFKDCLVRAAAELSKAENLIRTEDEQIRNHQHQIKKSLKALVRLGSHASLPPSAPVQPPPVLFADAAPVSPPSRTDVPRRKRRTSRWDIGPGGTKMAPPIDRSPFDRSPCHPVDSSPAKPTPSRLLKNADVIKKSRWDVPANDSTEESPTPMPTTSRLEHLLREANQDVMRAPKKTRWEPVVDPKRREWEGPEM